MAEQPIASRRLTTEELKRVHEWAKTAGMGGPGCCFCGTNSWSPFEELVELRPFSGRGLIIGGVVIPAILLTCNKCGHMELISALASGIVKPGQVREFEGKPEEKKANG